MNDDQREQILRLIWHLDRLKEIYSEITEDEFVSRAFKGWVDGIEIGKTLYYESFGLYWKCLKPLVDLVAKFGLEMDIHGSKEYEKFYLEIRDLRPPKKHLRNEDAPNEVE